MLVADYNIKLTYCPSTANVVANALSRKQEELKTQKEKDKAARTKAFLSPQQLELKTLSSPIANDLTSLCAAALEALTNLAAMLLLDNPYVVINRVIKINREHQILEPLRQTARSPKLGLYSLDEEGLLTYKGRLYVLEVDFICIYLIRAIHATQVTIYLSKRKTGKLLQDKYFQLQMQGDVDTYVATCKACRQSHVPRDKTLGLLKSLLILERAQQDVSVNFKTFPRDKKGYNNVIVVVNRLSKRTFSLPCYKEVIAS